MTEQQPQIANDEISLKELIQKIQEWFAYLRKQWKLIISIAALGGSIGFVYASFQKPSYIADITFVLEEENGGGLGSAMGFASSFGFDVGSNASSGLFSSSNIMELMKSRLVIEKTLLNPVQVGGKEISLAEYYIKINDQKKDIIAQKSPPLLYQYKAQFSYEQDSVLRSLYEQLKTTLEIIQKDRKASILNLTVKSNHELFSKLFCEQLLKETSDLYIETKSKKARLNLNILQKQTDSIRAELNNAINGVAIESDNVYNLNPALNVKKTPGTRKQVDVQANTAILTQLVSQLELSKVNLRKETPLVQIIDSPILPLQKEKLNKIRTFLLGIFIAGFLSVLYVSLIRFYKNLVS